MEDLGQSAVDAPNINAFKKSLEKVCRSNRMGFSMDYHWFHGLTDHLTFILLNGLICLHGVLD